MMAGPSLRNEAVDFIQAEIERVGTDKLDRGAIVKRFMEKGASRARVYDWLKTEIAAAKEPSPARDDLADDVARAEAVIAASKRAAVIREMPDKEAMAGMEREAREAIGSIRSRSVPDSPLPTVESSTGTGMIPVPAVVAPRPGGVGIVLAKLERAIDTVDQCITFAYGKNGELRNPRMALMAADGLRRCLETALKLHEAVDNVQAVQRFMDEVMAEVRGVSPEMANAVVERLQAVAGRWGQ